jgi:hypothetical protein
MQLHSRATVFSQKSGLGGLFEKKEILFGQTEKKDNLNLFDFTSD